MLAINALYRLPRGELLLQDAPELIEKVGTRAADHASSGRSSITLGSCCVIPIRHCRGNLNPPYASSIEMAVRVLRHHFPGLFLVGRQLLGAAAADSPAAVLQVRTHGRNGSAPDRH